MKRNELERQRVGATVRALRVAYGWRASKFALAVGVSHSYLANIEAGRRDLTPELARKVSSVLDVPLAAITTQYDVEAVA